MRKSKSILRLTFLFISVLWTVTTVVIAWWSVNHENDKMTFTIKQQARSFFKLIVTTRYWNSIHGGVYVPVTNDTQPNEHLDVPHRNIETIAGLKLTLINPAYMTRQIAEAAEKRDQIQYHITSLNPIRPANKPTV